MDSEKRIYNKTFNPGRDDGMFNACVGENGYVDKRTYGTGFAEAVDILTSALETMDERANLDTLIYPICFCARHHVELFLKAQIEQISTMRNVAPVVPSRLSASISSTHDLNILWIVLSNVARATDRRYTRPLAELEEFVRDIGQIDPTGQTFRYPSDTESQKHLIATPVINILSLRERFMALVSMIEVFEELSDSLSYEYNHGIYTSKLSRDDLRYIARNLPPYATWRSGNNISKSKAEIMQMFDLSSRDFNRAVDAIKTHPEFASYLGIFSPIPGLNKEVIDNFNRVLDDKLSLEDWTSDEMATIEALYEIAKPIYLSEEFMPLQKQLSKEFKFESYTQGQLRHRAKNTPRLIAGLQKISQNDLVEYAQRALTATTLLNRLEKENLKFAKAHPKIVLSPSKNNSEADNTE